MIVQSLPFRKLPGDRPFLGLAAGAAFVILASGLRWRFGGMSEGFGPMTFLPAILLAGLFGGIRIGLAFAILCTLISWVLFFPPYGTFTLASSHRISMLIFIFTALLELYVIRSLNAAIHALAQSQERSNTLFRELQHRVANNLQFVSALLWRGRKLLGPADEIAAEALDTARARLDMLSRVHRRLHDPRSVDAPVEEYLKSLCTDLIRASDTPDIELRVTSDSFVLDLEQLMSVSLIVAELVTNSLKHAFDERPEGVISVDIRASGGFVVLAVADDGPGLPDGFGTSQSERLGQGILHSLAQQLHGTISFEHGAGAVARLVFPRLASVRRGPSGGPAMAG